MKKTHHLPIFNVWEKLKLRRQIILVCKRHLFTAVAAIFFLLTGLNGYPVWAQGFKEAAEPVDIQARLQELLSGEKIKKVTLRGLPPGVKHDEAVNHLKQRWRFERATTMDHSEIYAPVRQDRAQYNRQRRSGGTLELKTMNDQRVGQITFVELYKDMLIHSRAQGWLTQQFGKPDDIKNYPYWSLFTWKSGSRRLQVKVANQLNIFVRGAGFKSKLALAIWNDAYEEHLAAKNKQCDKIRTTPRHKISVQETMWFGQRCPLVTGNHRRAGL